MNKSAIGREGYDLKFYDGQFSFNVNIYSESPLRKEDNETHWHCDRKVNQEMTVGISVRSRSHFSKRGQSTWRQRL